MEETGGTTPARPGRLTTDREETPASLVGRVALAGVCGSALRLPQVTVFAGRCTHSLLRGSSQEGPIRIDHLFVNKALHNLSTADGIRDQ